MVATPENLGLGQGILPLSVSSREAPATTVPKPEIKPAPGHKPGEHPKEKAPSSKKALIARLAGSLLALAGIAGPAVGHHINYESELNPPAVGRDIASVPGFYWNFGKSTIDDIQRRLGFKETPVPSTFDNNAEKIKIGDNNIQRITPEEARGKGILILKFNPETNTFILPFPFTLPQESTAILDKSEYEVRTIKHSEPRITVPAGTGIIIPEGMHYRLRGGNPEQNQDPNLVYSIAAFRYDTETDISIFLSFSPLPFSTDLTITPNKDVQTAINNGEGGSIDYWENLPISDGAELIGTTTLNQEISIFVSAFNGNRLDSIKIIKNGNTQLQQQDGKLLVLAPSN